MRAGDLDRRVTIRRIVDRTEDAHGGEVEVWADLAIVSAEVRPISDGERWRTGEAQVAAVSTHRFCIRWGLGVGPLDRLQYEGRVYEITGVKEIGRRVGQEITAVARAE